MSRVMYIGVWLNTSKRFFFFQAEDGIRDKLVTGVQTCALPISFSYLITLRLVPLFPFFLVNLVSGLTRVRLGTFVAATSIGIIPGSFVYANAGRQLGTINSLSEIASPRVLGAFALLGLLALIPIAYRKFANRTA